MLYAPIASLQNYLARYKARGKSDEQVNDLAETIRKQKVTGIFYLPSCGEDLPASIVPLDDIRPESLSSFYAEGKERIFSLSQFGFWLFLLKLSIHFTRMGERVRRFPN